MRIGFGPGLAAALAVAAAGAAPGPKDGPKVDERVVGRWAGVTALRDGVERPAPPGGVTYTFTADGRYALREGAGGKTDGGTFATDAGRDPAHLDLTPAAGGADPVGRCIYKVAGDELTLCFTKGDPAGARPTRFAAPEGSGAVVLTFKREKAKKD